LSSVIRQVVITDAKVYKNSKTSPGALFVWEAWEVMLGAKVQLFSESSNILCVFHKNMGNH
jgi:hypothetical protein